MWFEHPSSLISYQNDAIFLAFQYENKWIVTLSQIIQEHLISKTFSINKIAQNDNPGKRLESLSDTLSHNMKPPLARYTYSKYSSEESTYSVHTRGRLLALCKGCSLITLDAILVSVTLLSLNGTSSSKLSHSWFDSWVTQWNGDSLCMGERKLKDLIHIKLEILNHQ